MTKSAWVMAYFRSVYRAKLDITADGLMYIPISDEHVDVESLHLAVSHDLHCWTALNGNRPVMSKDNLRLRDPFVFRSPNGGFHCLGTGGGRYGMLHSVSSDLITWSKLRPCELMTSVPAVANVWAPKAAYDDRSGDWLVSWSSSSGENGWDDSRIWCARTADFISFTSPRVLFDPGFSVIDALVFRNGVRWNMIFKDERFGFRHGEHRYLQLAEADSIDGLYCICSGRLTQGIAEGPAIAKADDGGWRLLYDRCMDNDFGVLASPDLVTWSEVSGSVFPAHARHGSVIKIDAGELRALQKAFGGR